MKTTNTLLVLIVVLLGLIAYLLRPPNETALDKQAGEWRKLSSEAMLRRYDETKKREDALIKGGIYPSPQDRALGRIEERFAALQWLMENPPPAKIYGP